MPFISDPVVKQVNVGAWELTDDLVYAGRDDLFAIPAGFVTDFATVPRLVVWMFPKYGAYTRAAILHDYLLVTGDVPRHAADGLFRRVLRELNVSLLRRWMMWAGVRTASRMSHATPREWLAYLLVAPISLVFLAVPAAVVQLWLILFWVLELLVWVGGRLAGVNNRVPRSNMQAD